MFSCARCVARGLLDGFVMMKRLARRALPALLLAACASEAIDDGEAVEDELTAPRWTTPDPGNPWMRGVDLASLRIGEETFLPNEGELFEQMARDVEDMQRRLATVNGSKMRGFHAKGHGCVLGTLHVTVAESASRAKVGLFAENKTFPTWVRYSNGTGFVQADRRTDVRGVAFKVMGVPGRKLLPGAEDATTQDILMTNGPITPAASSIQFVQFGKALTDARVTPDGEEVGAVEGLLQTGGFLLRRENQRIRRTLLSHVLPRVESKGSLLGEQFWTGGAIAMGVEPTAPGEDPLRAPAKQAAKMTAIAGVMRDGACVPVRDLPNPFDSGYLRKDLRERMKNAETCLELRMQFQEDPRRQLIEDTSVEWLESDSPMMTVGYVSIPRIDLDDPATAGAEAFCEGLSWSPWHTLPEHRPLGNIQRARLAVYEASRRERGGSPEPTGQERF